MAKTLLSMLGAQESINKLSDSALIIVDAQREYLDGKLPLSNIKPALQEIGKLLKKARQAKSNVFFIRHAVAPGSPVFNPESEYFQIIDEIAPEGTEKIIDKNYPNSFAKTSLDSELKKLGINNLIVTGFMTHACISTTVRAAAEMGYKNTLVASACATRDLVAADGSTIEAKQVHQATIAALKDLFATVIDDADKIDL